MKVYYKRNVKNALDMINKFGFVFYEGCCEKMKGTLEPSGAYYFPRDVSWDYDKGYIYFDTSSGEYGSNLTDIQYCPYCGANTELIDVLT